MPPVKRYTDAELDFIQEALVEGVPNVALARFFDVSPTAMCCLIQRHGLKQHTSPTDLEELAEKYGLRSHRIMRARFKAEVDNSL